MYQEKKIMLWLYIHIIFRVQVLSNVTIDNTMTALQQNTGNKVSFNKPILITLLSSLLLKFHKLKERSWIQQPIKKSDLLNNPTSNNPPFLFIRFTLPDNFCQALPRTEDGIPLRHLSLTCNCKRDSTFNGPSLKSC